MTHLNFISHRAEADKITHWKLWIISLLGAPQREVYFMGLIDVLTQYDTKRKAAHAAKAVKHGVREQWIFNSFSLLLSFDIFQTTVLLCVFGRLELKSQQFIQNSMLNASESSSLKSLPSSRIHHHLVCDSQINTKEHWRFTPYIHLYLPCKIICAFILKKKNDDKQNVSCYH